MHVENIREIRKPVVSKAKPFGAIRDSDEALCQKVSGSKVKESICPGCKTQNKCHSPIRAIRAIRDSKVSGSEQGNWVNVAHQVLCST